MCDKQINVLEVIQQGEIGGGESHLLTLIQHLDKKAFKPIVIALSDGEMINRLNQMGIRNYVVPTSMPFNFFTWSKISQIIRENRIDIVHTHGARSLSNLFQPASKNKIPLVHTVHGWSFHDHLPAWKRRLRIAGEKYLTGKADMNIAVSDSNEKIAIRHFGRFKCRVINNGVDLNQYNDLGAGKIRKELGIPEDALLVSFIARFIHDKNPIVLIKSFNQLLKEKSNAYLMMVGNGPARDEAIALTKELGIENKVLFPGFRTDVPDLLSASDIFCLPSIKEGLPVSLIEAMATGNAVIATEVQGCIDVVTHEKDGLLVSLENLEKDLTVALKRLSDNPELRKQLAIAGRKKVEERFDARLMADRIEMLYRDLCKQNYTH